MIEIYIYIFKGAYESCLSCSFKYNRSRLGTAHVYGGRDLAAVRLDTGTEQSKSERHAWWHTSRRCRPTAQPRQSGNFLCPGRNAGCLSGRGEIVRMEDSNRWRCCVGGWGCQARLVK